MPPPVNLAPKSSLDFARFPIRRPLSILAILLFVLALLVAGAELGLRYFVGLGDPILIASDRSCGYVLKPNQHKFRFFVHTDINSQSMRSEEFSPSKPAGAYRIMCLGDSIAYGTTRVDQNDIFTQVLRRELPSDMHAPVRAV